MTNLLHRFKSKAHKRFQLYKCFNCTFSSQFKLFIVDDTHHGVVIFLQMPLNTLNKKSQGTCLILLAI